jgi:predicted amidohydrolase
MALNQGAELIIAPALWCLEDAGFVGLGYDPDSERKLVNAMCTARAFENEIVMVFVNGSASPRYYGTVDPANDMVLPSNFGTLAGQTQIAVPFKGAVCRCNHYYEEMIVQNVDVGRLTRDAEKVYQIRSDWAIQKAAKL